LTEVSDGKSRATRRIDCDGDRFCWMRRAVVRPITPALFAGWRCQLSLFYVGGGFVVVLFSGGGGGWVGEGVLTLLPQLFRWACWSCHRVEGRRSSGIVRNL
jgi:hypothetical protein